MLSAFWSSSSDGFLLSKFRWSKNNKSPTDNTAENQNNAQTHHSARAPQGEVDLVSSPVRAGDDEEAWASPHGVVINPREITDGSNLASASRPGAPLTVAMKASLRKVCCGICFFCCADVNPRFCVCGLRSPTRTGHAGDIAECRTPPHNSPDAPSLRKGARDGGLLF